MLGKKTRIYASLLRIAFPASLAIQVNVGDIDCGPSCQSVLQLLQLKTNLVFTLVIEHDGETTQLLA